MAGDLRDSLSGRHLRASGRAGGGRGCPASGPPARDPAVPAAHPAPGQCGRPPLTYRLKTQEGFRRGVAALSPDTAAERPAAVGERLPPRVASRPGSPRQAAGGGARARAWAGGAPGAGPLNRRRASVGPGARGGERGARTAGGDLRGGGAGRGARASSPSTGRPGEPPRTPSSELLPRGTARQPVCAAWWSGPVGCEPARLCEGGRRGGRGWV